MQQLIFQALFVLLSLSPTTAPRSMHMGCNAPARTATECWIVNPDTGATAWITPQGITYTRGSK